ncbi:DUF4113 domain-containing protein [Spirosoma gilvum]
MKAILVRIGAIVNGYLTFSARTKRLLTGPLCLYLISDPEWPMKPKYLSPCYTTRWQDILVVK